MRQQQQARGFEIIKRFPTLSKNPLKQPTPPHAEPQALGPSMAKCSAYCAPTRRDISVDIPTKITGVASVSRVCSG